jgi:two-component system cell cycle sensor histidine kinase/response regulator CckA
VMVSVSDTGSGMAPDIVARAFEPFFTTKEKCRGTGLGLATAYGLVRQAGGTIAIQSEVGVGTLVRFVLPVTEEQYTARPRRELPSYAGAGETVLVVEDEPALRQLVRRLLDQAGYVVLDAAGGEEALAVAASAGRIDLLLVDLVMPGMSGKQLATTMMRSHPELRVVTTSGFVTEEMASHGILDGEFPFLSKPFTRDQLLRAVREALEDPRPVEADQAIAS